MRSTARTDLCHVFMPGSNPGSSSLLPSLAASPTQLRAAEPSRAPWFRSGLQSSSNRYRGVPKATAAPVQSQVGMKGGGCWWTWQRTGARQAEKKSRVAKCSCIKKPGTPHLQFALAPAASGINAFASNAAFPGTGVYMPRA